MQECEQIETAIRNAAVKNPTSPNGMAVVAYGLLRMATEIGHVASALHLLGTGNAATEMGAIEYLTGEVKEVASALRAIGDAVESALDSR